jgi:hypothetical protein
MNDQKTVVDYKYWLKMDLWTIKEAASLLSSIEPNSDASNSMIPLKVENMIIASLAAKNLVADFIADETRFYPQSIIKWAKFNKGFRIPEQLDEFYEDNVADEYPDVQNQPNVVEKNTETEIYISEILTKLNQAAYKFWANADPKDTDTHPINEEVMQWLMSHGISEVSARQGTTIIRPKWGAKGRRKTK